MMCNTTSHFQYHRILLLILGLWPYQQSKLVQLQYTFIFGILTSCIVTQLLVFLSAEFTMNVGIKVLSVALFAIIFTIKYSSFRIYTQVVKGSLDDLQHICNKLEDKNEIAIIEKYGQNTKRLTAIATFFLLLIVTGFMLLSILVYIPGVLFINEVQVRRVTRSLMPVYYLDDEKYFYLVLLHVNAVVQIGGTTMVATGMMFFSWYQHACGMFRIASYRIEKALMINTVKNRTLRNKTVNCKEIILAVDIHREAVKFCEFVFSNFQGIHLVLMMVSVICLSLNLYRITEITSFGNDFVQLLVPLLIIVSLFGYFFIANYAGQELTDHHEHVFSTAYNVPWYLAPLHVQKLILFLLQRGSKTFILSLGGIFGLSSEFFATLIKVSISYFTIVCSIQQ